MAKFKMTPARRDLLRLTCRNNLYVEDLGGRFLRYEIEGQLKQRISQKNFSFFMRWGWLEFTGKEGGMDVYAATHKTRTMFKRLEARS